MKRVLAVVVLTLAALGLPVPAQAASGAIVVTGLQTYVTQGECYDPEAIASYEMTGGLLGCWYITAIDSEVGHPGGTVKVSGTETFIGCIDADGNETCDGEGGEFDTTFTYTGKYTGDSYSHGRCHHPISSGTDAFANAKGLINFHDNIGDDEGTADYSGPISL
jgi:hypothetical protein